MLRERERKKNMISKVLSLHRSIELELTKIISLLRDFRLEHARPAPSPVASTLQSYAAVTPPPPPHPPRFVSDTNRDAARKLHYPTATGNRRSYMRSFVAPHLIVRKRPHVVFYDLETTGLGPTDKIGIREIGAAAFSNNGIFRRPVTPTQKITAGALAVAPMASDAGDAKQWSSVGRDFYAWLACQLATAEPMPTIYIAGYNSKRYDSRILMFENRRHDVSIPANVARNLRFVDMLEVIRTLEPDIDKPRTLERVHQKMVGNAITSAHTALGDTYALKDISLVLKDRHGDKFWHELKNRAESLDGVMKRCKLVT